MRLIFLALCLFLLGCGHSSLIDSRIAEYVKKNGHNPDSYEPVSTVCIDTIVALKQARGALEILQGIYENDSNESIIEQKIKIDSLVNLPDTNRISGYTFVHEFRGRVPLGGMMLKRALVETDENLNIVSFVED